MRLEPCCQIEPLPAHGSGSRSRGCPRRLAPQGERKRVGTYSRIWAGARRSRLKSTSSAVEKRDSLRPALQLRRKLYTQSEVWFPRASAPNAAEKREKTGKQLSASSLLRCSVELVLFFFFVFFKPPLMSLGVFFLILKYAFQETEPSGPQAAKRGRSAPCWWWRGGGHGRSGSGVRPRGHWPQAGRK